MAWELVQVEMSIYERTGPDGPLHLMVPHLRGMLVPEGRQVVRVIIDGGERPRVVVERTKSDPEGGYVRQRWSEQRFRDEFTRAPLEGPIKEFGEGLLRLGRDFPDIQLSWGTGKTGSVTLKRNGSGLIEYYLDGMLRFRKDYFAPAVGEEHGKEYLAVLKSLFPREMDLSYPVVLPGKDAKPQLDTLLSTLRSILEKTDRVGDKV
jgi:hypothetical protein